ncbi:hypothetical protein AAFF_G00129470 [Aldrovandia affinis]|uniref:Uncharacterized protein n=1 Tax=Aldrovandia affinis TaxID=143900 RepID=A0AAD7T382_9TELE|nr:hypothetical protein AAFF_G00129470 [Aldrovandia affinis]
MLSEPALPKVEARGRERRQRRPGTAASLEGTARLPTGAKAGSLTETPARLLLLLARFFLEQLGQVAQIALGSCCRRTP